MRDTIYRTLPALLLVICAALAPACAEETQSTEAPFQLEIDGDTIPLTEMSATVHEDAGVYALRLDGLHDPMPDAADSGSRYELLIHLSPEALADKASGDVLRFSGTGTFEAGETDYDLGAFTWESDAEGHDAAVLDVRMTRACFCFHQSTRTQRVQGTIVLERWDPASGLFEAELDLTLEGAIPAGDPMAFTASARGHLAGTLE